MRDVTIKPVMNGWIVKAGCCRLVFTDLDKMCKELKRYCQDPDKVGEEYTKKAVNKNCGEEQAGQNYGASMATITSNASDSINIGS